MSILILLSLATYRLTLLISQEKGPYEIFKKFRKLIGIHEKEIPYEEKNGTIVTVIETQITNEFAFMVDCKVCLSGWISFILCLLFLPLSFDLILNWLAVYGLVYLTFEVSKD